MDEKPHFPELQLDFIESRIIGCLLEKETTTPDYYPMTLKSLEAAANQSSNRYPVTKLTEDEVAEGIQRLRDKELIMQVHISGSRVPKYEHQLPEILDLSSAENAVLTVLLLRGIQTAGELKQRSERLHPFESPEQVEEILQGFIEYSYGPLVKELPAGGGRRVKTYGHLLGGEPGYQESKFTTTSEEPIEPDWKTAMEERVAALEEQIAALHSQLGLTSESQ